MKKKFVSVIVLFLAFFGLSPNNVIAMPMLDEPVELPANFEGIITIYPDSHSSPTVRSYWLVPSIARIYRHPDNKLAFGLVHSGLSSFDPDGIGVLLTATIQPYVDEATAGKAKKLLEDKAKADGATANFRYISPTETSVNLLVGGQYLNWSGKPDTIITGGSVEAGMPFNVKVKDATDARALAQAGGDDANTIGALYTMKFKGVRNRCHFKVTANFKETYEHFKATVSGSGWFGLVKAQARTEWQTLKGKGGVKFQVWECSEEKAEKLYPDKIINGLMEALTARTGAFARVLKPSGLPDAPGGAGRWGWSLSAGGGFESTDEETEIVYEYDAQFTEEQEIAFGMTFPSAGPELTSYVKNLTDSKKKFPTSSDYKAIAGQHKNCKKKNLEALKKLHDEGALDDNQYHEFVAEALKKGCYVDYSVDSLLKISGLTALKEMTHPVNLTPMILELLNSPTNE